MHRLGVLNGRDGGLKEIPPILSPLGNIAF